MTKRMQKAVTEVIYDCCHSLSQPSMRHYTWGMAKDYLTEHVGHEVDRVLSMPQGVWTCTPPAEPGWYWYRDFMMGRDEVRHVALYIVMLNENGLFEMTGSEPQFTPDEMLRHNGEFWSEKLKEPQG